MSDSTRTTHFTLAAVAALALLEPAPGQDLIGQSIDPDGGGTVLYLNAGTPSNPLTQLPVSAFLAESGKEARRTLPATAASGDWFPRGMATSPDTRVTCLLETLHLTSERLRLTGRGVDTHVLEQVELAVSVAGRLQLEKRKSFDRKSSRMRMERVTDAKALYRAGGFDVVLTGWSEGPYAIPIVATARLDPSIGSLQGIEVVAVATAATPIRTEDGTLWLLCDNASSSAPPFAMHRPEYGQWQVAKLPDGLKLEYGRMACAFGSSLLCTATVPAVGKDGAGGERAGATRVVARMSYGAAPEWSAATPLGFHVPEESMHGVGNWFEALDRHGKRLVGYVEPGGKVFSWRRDGR